MYYFCNSLIMKEIRIIDIIGTPNAIIHNFGVQVFNVIKPYLESGEEITLSFDGLRNITSGFCNASIGKAYLEYKDAGRLIIIKGADGNPIWLEKVQDAIDLTKNQEKVRLQDIAISELFIS